MRRYWLLSALVTLPLATLVGCPASTPALCDYGTCDSPDGSGSSSSGDGSADVSTIDAPPGCDLTKDPKDSPACIDDAVGIFVSPTGSDGATGAKGAPVKTIGKALSIAGPKRVYVCEGSYDGFELKTGTTIAGGFACADWKYTGTKPKVEGADGTKPTVDLAATGALLLDLEINGPAKGAPNSVALRAVDSTATLRRVKLSAGEGADGADGVRTDFTYPAQADLNGNDASIGGGEKSYTCSGGAVTKGGKGGGSGIDGDPGTPALGGGAGGTVVNCINLNQGGGNGATGTSPTVADGAKTLGTITASQWTPQAGANGANGGPGQGGGGGAGAGGGGGGGGGAGGCGGAGGPGGKGGGASIALLSINSTLTLETSSLNASKAGNGGKGVAGQAGQTIFGFGGTKTGGGCNGGNGGKGGDGAAGGGGAGGLSAALLYTKTKPTLKDTTTSAGTAGSAGVGGVPSSNDGVAGDSKTELEIK